MKNPIITDEYGYTNHYFVERLNYSGTWVAGFVRTNPYGKEVHTAFLGRISLTGRIECFSSPEAPFVEQRFRFRSEAKALIRKHKSQIGDRIDSTRFFFEDKEPENVSRKHSEKSEISKERGRAINDALKIMIFLVIVIIIIAVTGIKIYHLL